MRSILGALVLVAFSFVPASGFAQGYSGPTRIDFDDRLIQGQTKKAGSVYIYNRQQIQIDSLVRIKRSFRSKVIRTVFENER